MLVLFGSLIILPIYLQNVLALSTLSTGLLLPGDILMGLLSPVVGRLYVRVGPTPSSSATRPSSAQRSG